MVDLQPVVDIRGSLIKCRILQMSRFIVNAVVFVVQGQITITRV